MYKWNVSRTGLLGLFSMQLLLAGCSRDGYIEVRNQSDAMIENVRWGHVVELGRIEVGQEAGTETEHYGACNVFFSKGGKNHVSKKSYSVDAKTSATYTHKDSSDADIVNE